MNYSIIVKLNDKERAELRKAIQSHPFDDFQQDYWKKMTDEELKGAVVECLLSTQTKWESVERFSKSPDAKDVWMLPQRTLEKTLRNYGIRFPQRKAEWIASSRLAEKGLRAPIVQELDKIQGRGSVAAREARRVLTRLLADDFNLKGMGPKQVSHLIVYYLYFTKDIVPIDIRWEKFFRSRRLFSEDDDQAYILCEDLITCIAREMGVTPADLDTGVWYSVGED